MTYHAMFVTAPVRLVQHHAQQTHRLFYSVHHERETLLYMVDVCSFCNASFILECMEERTNV